VLLEQILSSFEHRIISGNLEKVEIFDRLNSFDVKSMYRHGVKLPALHLMKFVEIVACLQIESAMSGWFYELSKILGNLGGHIIRYRDTIIRMFMILLRAIIRFKKNNRMLKDSIKFRVMCKKYMSPVSHRIGRS